MAARKRLSGVAEWSYFGESAVLLQQPQHEEDSEGQEEERGSPPREHSQSGRCKEKAERPGEGGQDPKDENQDQYHGVGYRPASERALGAGQVVLDWVVCWVRFVSRLNPLAYDPNGLATALRGTQQAKTCAQRYAKNQTNDEAHILPPS